MKIATYGNILNTHLKDMYIVIDTETLGWKYEAPELNQKVFDLGYKVIDSNGHEYDKGSFIVLEFWEQTIKEQAFYKEKYPFYKKYVESGYSKVLPFNEIIEILSHAISVYDVDFLVAYNLGFDDNVIRKTHNFLNNKELTNAIELFPTVQKFDLYHMSCQTILNTPKYIGWASENAEKGHINTKTFNVSTGAESCYSYLINEPDYIEQHTALSDVEIECYILVKALETSKEYDYSINSQSWRIPNTRKDKHYIMQRHNPTLAIGIHEMKVLEKEKKEKKAQKKRKK